jgi:hypothetical protein
MLPRKPLGWLMLGYMIATGTLLYLLLQGLLNIGSRRIGILSGMCKLVVALQNPVWLSQSFLKHAGHADEIIERKKVVRNYLLE